MASGFVQIRGNCVDFAINRLATYVPMYLCTRISVAFSVFSMQEGVQKFNRAVGYLVTVDVLSKSTFIEPIRATALTAVATARALQTIMERTGRHPAVLQACFLCSVFVWAEIQIVCRVLYGLRYRICGSSDDGDVDAMGCLLARGWTTTQQSQFGGERH